MDVLSNLQAFLAVARVGGFASAARELGVATSVVSKRIEQLEQRTNAKLFHRTTRTVALTDEAAVWLPRIESIVLELTDALDALSDTESPIHGTIRLKAPATLTLEYLSPILFEFQSFHPKVSLDLTLNDRLVNPLDEDFDIVIAGIPGGFSGVVEKAICPSRRLLAASPDYIARYGEPKHPEDLKRFELLNFTPMGKCWTFMQNGKTINIEVHPVLNANDGQVVLSAALAHKGIALLTQYTFGPSLKTRQLVPVLRDFEVQPHLLRALIPESKSKLARIQVLVSCIQKRLGPVPPWADSA